MESVQLESASQKEIMNSFKEGYKIISKYKILVEAYILDFFTRNFWHEVPEDWRQYLETYQLDELTALIDFRLPLKNDPPETLKEIRYFLNKYSLSRNQSVCSTKVNREGVTPLYKEIMNLKSHFSKSIFKQVKHKKRHEIMVMSEVVYESTCKNRVDFVIDIGAGKGHLARVLSMCYNIKVIAIEQNDLFTREAERLDGEVEHAAVWDGCNEKDIFMPVHVTERIEYDVSVEEFEDSIKDIYFKKFPAPVSNYTYGIIGLHPCGNLGPTLLRLYKQSKRCQLINLVSCCYHKLNTKQEPSPDFPNVVGYPLSPPASEFDSELSYAARELACHAIEKYSQKLSSGNYEYLNVHAFRAVLEKLIMDKYPQKRHSKITNVKFKPGMTFTEYQAKALQNTDMEFTESELSKESTLHMLKRWKQVVIFYCLRLMFAPLIETLMLLDRHMFVDHYDHGFCDIVPYFDCDISPRTHIFLANKFC